MTKLTYIASYKVDVSKEVYAIALSFANDAASVQRELSSLVLVELEVEDVSGDFDLMSVKQPHTESVPYDESYYDPTSLQAFHLFKPPLNRFRVAFFLHFYDASQPLNTPWGSLRCSEPMEKRPSHLLNKNYIYWR